ncbi:TPA: dihydrofolate reductase [Legionella pneumophila]|nr:dihydrofolate reductase [Legionella pneumophila]HBC0467392.1 dihydrofolate reductase [Legionella pneumophila]HBD9373362.1 dihydrofolate reductase [Legionella pneumophila]HBI2944990.1 dihydrofolate reductase [Legionella pneumophila]HDV6632097.1 dihydrofolate reductase [Legionella pneumophila]
MKPSVYLTNQFLEPIIPMLIPDWNIIHGWKVAAGMEYSKVEALATTVWDQIDHSFLMQFPNLKIISHLGIGTDNIDIHFLKQNHIILHSQPNAGVHDTAELAIALLLTLTRKIILNDRYTRNNDWIEQKPRFRGNHLLGKQLGLVGFGQIGVKVAQFAEPFGLKIAYTARSQKNSPYLYCPTAAGLASISDFLIICCSGGVETQHIINKQVLDNLGPEGYLINVARGSIVDQNALIDALQRRAIAGAGLDVYQYEPEVPLALRQLDNVVLSPHMGSSTKENLNQMFQLQAKHLNQYLNEFLRKKESCHPLFEEE